MIYYNGTLYEDVGSLSEHLYMFNAENFNIIYAVNDMLLFLPWTIPASRTPHKGPFKVELTLPPEVDTQISEVIFPPTADNSEENQVNELNYNSFIRVMAEMVQKYASNLLKKEAAEQ